MLPQEYDCSIALIRHGKTLYNLRHAYLGRLDAPLCPQGITELTDRTPPRAELVLSSPLLRCRQTAQLLYPDQTPLFLPDLQERDFGELDGLTHWEIIQLPGMEHWGMTPESMLFPAGEESAAFHRRSLQGFEQAVGLLAQSKASTGAIITHGGVLMAILCQLFPHSAFYDWQVGCGTGWLLTATARQLEIQPLSMGKEHPPS